MLQNCLHGIEKPGRYVGCEVNSRRKSFEDAEVRFALAFPDVYEVGFSHLGLRLLYSLLNDLDGVMADRVYSPWFDFESSLRENGEPLRAIESGVSLDQFDFLGFSLQYELSYTNILTMLDLCGIPFQSKDRGTEHPLVIAGGPCAFNPEPLADFFDLIVLGEAEEVLPELIEAFRAVRSSRGDRHEFLRQARRIPGVYVPSFFKPDDADGLPPRVVPVYPDYTSVRKRLVSDMSRVPVPDRPLVPLIDVVHNRLGLEIARGCTRGCRFCQASFIYRPVRERSRESVLQAASVNIGNSGFEELSLLSLSTGDYCGIAPLLGSLIENLSANKVAVSLPSMRVGTLTPELMKLIHGVRKTGFTLAPEAGSERLRRVINKGILDDDLLSAVENAYSLGWRVLKLYFMMGLPTETMEDMESMTALCRRVWELGKKSRATVNVSVSTFVPKAQTPFQWSGQITRSEIDERLVFLKDRLRKPGMRFKWSHPDHSLLEAVFARGDRGTGKTLVRAWQLGARFDGWTEHFNRDIWDRAFAETGVDPRYYAERERPLDEPLPWDHLSSGVDKSYLINEHRKAMQEEFTPDCRWNACTACGVCDHKTVAPMLNPAEASPDRNPVSKISVQEEEVLYWLRYSKIGNIRFFGQLEISQVFSRAVRRCGLPAAFSKGFHPHVKLSFQDALPLGMETTVGEVCVTLTQRIDPERVKSLLNEELPAGLTITDAARMAHRLAGYEHRQISYRVSELSPWDVREIVQGWRERLSEQITKKTKKSESCAVLGDILLDIRQLDETTIEMDLYEGPRICFRPTAVLQHLTDETKEHFAGSLVRKVGVCRASGPEERACPQNSSSTAVCTKPGSPL